MLGTRNERTPGVLGEAMRAMPWNRRDARTAPRCTVIGLLLLVAIALAAVSSPARGATAADVPPATAARPPRRAPPASTARAARERQADRLGDAHPVRHRDDPPDRTIRDLRRRNDSDHGDRAHADAHRAPGADPGELQYRTVAAPGFGRVARLCPGREDLHAHPTGLEPVRAGGLPRRPSLPLGERQGPTIKAEELLTAACEQPAPPSSASSGTATATVGAGAGATGAAS